VSDLKPKWTKKQQRAGQKIKQAWESFFATAGKDPQAGRQPLANEGQGVPAAIQARHESELLRYPNVVGVATGMRMRGGKPTGEACLVVYVRKKFPVAQLAEHDVLPRSIEGIPVDVVDVGDISALSNDLTR
jgi:hypothetical protein